VTRTAGIAGVLLGIAAAHAAHAQSASAFEVASVKASPARSGTAGFIAMDTDPAMVRYSNITLKLLIAIAYKMDSDLIQGGPAWLDGQLYDLTAKLPAGISKDRVPPMLQTLLAERFRLAVHRDAKEQRVYFLTVAKSGTKLKPVPKADDQDVEQVRGESLPGQIVRGGIMGHSLTMAAFAGILAIPLGDQVVDHTGLAGAFDINLKWTPDDSNPGGPGLLTAIQEQLGLKLEPGKAPVEMLVIDHAERIPIEN